MTTQKGFLFLACEGRSGCPTPSQRRLKNRHAQLANPRRSSQTAGEVDPVPAPLAVQIKFKASDQSKQPETYFGRCGSCRKRRKLLCLSNKCTKCDMDGATRPHHSSAKQTGPLNKHRNRTQSAGTCQTSPPLSIVICDISCGRMDCPADRKAMHYFLNFAALDLSGYMPGQFWDGLVLQGGQSEPMVRQAVLAVSSAHLERCSDGMTSSTSLALYQASINKLRIYMSRETDPSPELVLICCILLFTFDRLRGENAAASVHLKSAMAILTTAPGTLAARKHQDSAVGRKQDSMNDLTSRLVQMDIEDTMPVLDRGPLLDMDIDAPEFAAQDPPPMQFFSPREFMAPWMRICHAVWAFVGRNASYRHAPVEEIPISVWDHRRNLQRWVKAWRLAHKRYMSLAGTPDVSQLPTTPSTPAFNGRIVDAINTLIIESHYFVIKSVLAESLPDPCSARPWDLIAEKMLQCGEKALALRQAYRKMHSLPLGKTFSTHVGIVESLLCLSHRTISSNVRSRAQLLIRGFRDVAGNLTGVTAFFAGYGAPPKDLVLIYEKPGH